MYARFPALWITRFAKGAVDFIFGRGGLAFFGSNTIGVSDAGFVTASGRESNDEGSCKFEHASVCLLPSTH